MAATPLPRDARWIWVSLPHATFLLGTAGGRVVAAPPIARWTVGRSERDVADYLLRRPGVRVVPLS